LDGIGLDRLGGLDVGRLRLAGLRGRAPRGARSERDLETRRRGAEAVMALVAGAAAVLAHHDLRAALVAEHPRGHLRVAEQHDRLEALAFLGGDAIDDERLAVADAVLLVAELDDRVVHGLEGVRAWKSGRAAPATRSSVAAPRRLNVTPFAH